MCIFVDHNAELLPGQYRLEHHHGKIVVCGKPTDLVCSEDEEQMVAVERVPKECKECIGSRF